MLPDIDSALIQAYQTLNLGIAAAFTNMPSATGGDFVPPTDAIWATVDNICGPISVATMGDTGEDNVTGYLQISLNAPVNTGSSGINANREAIRSYFRLGRSFTYNGQDVRIVYAKLSPVFRNGNYATGMIQLYWSAYLSRSN